VYFSSLAEVLVEGIAFNVVSHNGSICLFGEGAFTYSFIDDQFACSVSTNDYMGIGLYLRGSSSVDAIVGVFERDNFGSGLTTIPNGLSHTPAFYCNDCGTQDMENSFFQSKGIIFRGDQSGPFPSTFSNIYAQGLGMPFITATTRPTIIQKNIVLDSVPNPAYVAMNPGASVTPGLVVFADENPGQFDIANANVSGLRVSVIGNGVIQPGVGNSSGKGQGAPSRMVTTTQQGSFKNPSTGNIEDYLLVQDSAGISVNGGYEMFINNLPQAAPTCSVSAGGAHVLGTFYYRVVPQWQNGNNGIFSLNSNGCTTSSGNQTITVTWAAASGNPKNYEVYEDPSTGGISTGASCGLFAPNVFSAVFSAANSCQGNSINLLPAGGPTMMMSGTQGMVAPAYVTSGPVGFTSTATMPNATANRTVSLPDTSGLEIVSTYQNSANDNFNRANENPLSNSGKWTAVLNTWVLTSNTANGNSGGNVNNVVLWNANSFGNDQFAQLTISAIGSSFSGPSVRVSGSGGTANWYTCFESTTQMIFQRSVNGTATNITTTGITGATGDVVRIEVAGTSVTCKQNGNVISTTTDNSLTSGSVGMEMFNNGSSVDNWSGGNLHPIAQLDTEQDWTPPQHFIGPVTRSGRRIRWRER
jgi:hypothetical protein